VELDLNRAEDRSGQRAAQGKAGSPPLLSGARGDNVGCMDGDCIAIAIARCSLV